MWEITGAEFSKSTAHTAGGISVRFPRVTRIRDDKDWTNATDLARLKVHNDKKWARVIIIMEQFQVSYVVYCVLVISVILLPFYIGPFQGFKRDDRYTHKCVCNLTYRRIMDAQNAM